MCLGLEKIPYEKMETIKVDKETLENLQELVGLDDCCYDWWELSQAIKNVVVGLNLIKNAIK